MLIQMPTMKAGLIIIQLLTNILLESGLEAMLFCSGKNCLHFFHTPRVSVMLTLKLSD